MADEPTPGPGSEREGASTPEFECSGGALAERIQLEETKPPEQLPIYEMTEFKCAGGALMEMLRNVDTGAVRFRGSAMLTGSDQHADILGPIREIYQFEIPVDLSDMNTVVSAGDVRVAVVEPKHIRRAVDAMPAAAQAARPRAVQKITEIRQRAVLGGGSGGVLQHSGMRVPPVHPR